MQIKDWARSRRSAMLVALIVDLKMCYLKNTPDITKCCELILLYPFRLGIRSFHRSLSGQHSSPSLMCAE